MPFFVLPSAFGEALAFGGRGKMMSTDDARQVSSQTHGSFL